MNNSHDTSNSNEDEQEAISTSLQLALLSSILIVIADGIATIAALSAIDESIEDAKKEKQSQKDLDNRFNTMQQQIDDLEMQIANLTPRRW